jgi:capsid portal protein
MAIFKKKDENTSVLDSKTAQEIIPYVSKNDECIITDAFITDSDDPKLVEVENSENKELREFAKSVSSIFGSSQKKYVEGRADREEYSNNSYQTGDQELISPPFDPLILEQLIQIDEVHYRCCRTKTIDSVGRQWDILPTPLSSGHFDATLKLSDKDKEIIRKEIELVRNFIEECNTADGFEGILDRGGMDSESIGWAALEVIRSVDFKIARLNHIPASRVRVLKGKRGFVELTGKNNKKIYYQNFGEKVVSRKRKDIVTNKAAFYKPLLDGELSSKNVQWSLIDRETGLPTKDLAKAAHELLFIPKYHPKSIHYGIPDGIAALGHIIGNLHIRDYFLQFFEHNAVPQYAIVIKGAKLSEDVKKVIHQFFKEEIKGSAHKTLIIPVPSSGGDVEIIFEKLSSEEKEGSFQVTRSNNQQSIMTAHGVSPAIIGINEAASLGSGKGASQSENYKNRIIMPSQARWARELTKLFRLGLGVTRVRLDFDPLDIRDEKEEASVLLKYLVTGVMTINQVREKAKLGDPIPGGERAFMVVGSQVLFVDDLTSAPSSLLEALKNTQNQLNNVPNPVKKKGGNKKPNG